MVPHGTDVATRSGYYITVCKGRATWLRLKAPDAGNIDLTIYSMSGRTACCLAVKAVKLGDNLISWDAIDRLKNGVYFLALKKNGVTRSVSRLTICR